MQAKTMPVFRSRASVTIQAIASADRIAISANEGMMYRGAPKGTRKT